MGMFDSVWFECPKAGCHGRVEVQSKAGECSLHDYTRDNAPAKVAADIIGERGTCDRCREAFTVTGHVHVCLEWR